MIPYNNQKTIILSISKYIDYKLIKGQIDFTPIKLYRLLLDYIEYCKIQDRFKNEGYLDKIVILQGFLEKLEETCPSICYKYENVNEYTLSRKNTSPVINDNTIILPLINEIQQIPYDEVIYGYKDKEYNELSFIKILYSDNKNNFHVNNRQVIENKLYVKNSLFGIKSKHLTDTSYILVKNKNVDNKCEPNIIVLKNKNDYIKLKDCNNVKIEKNKIECKTVEEGVIKNYSIEISNLSLEELKDVFEIVVKDNHIKNPLYSNKAKITIKYILECNELPICVSSLDDIQFVYKSKDKHVFKISDFTANQSITNIRIEKLNIRKGTLKFNNLELTNTLLPFIIHKSRISELIYDANMEEIPGYTDNFQYSMSFDNDVLNFCKTLSMITLSKPEKPIVYPIINAEDMDIQLDKPGDLLDLNLDAKVEYSESDGYKIVWYIVNQATVLVFDPKNRYKDIFPISNVGEGKYVFRIVVTTNERKTVVKKTINLNVSLKNQMPTVRAGDDIIFHLPDEDTKFTAKLTAKESDYENKIVKRKWTQISGPTIAYIDNSESLNTEISGMIAGYYKFRITVTDDAGNTASDECLAIIIFPDENFTVDAGDDKEVNVSEESILLTATVYNNYGSNIISYLWDLVKGPAFPTISAFNEQSATLLGYGKFVKGHYKYEVIVRDDQNHVAYDTVEIDIVEDKIIPDKEHIVTEIDENIRKKDHGNVEAYLTVKGDSGTIIDFDILQEVPYNPDDPHKDYSYIIDYWIRVTDKDGTKEYNSLGGEHMLQMTIPDSGEIDIAVFHRIIKLDECKQSDLKIRLTDVKNGKFDPSVKTTFDYSLNIPF